MHSHMDGPTSYAIAEPFTLIAAIAALLAGYAWLSVAAALRKTNVGAFQATSFAARLQSAAILTGRRADRRSR